MSLNGYSKKISGFTLVEFLVALLIFAIGILSLTALQLRVLRGDISAHNYAQAIQVAYSMMDRLRSNRNAALAGSYNITDVSEITDGDGLAPLADDDLASWRDNELDLLPDPNVTISCSSSGNCSVTVIWDDSQGDSSIPSQSTTLNSNI
ncbi:type IV pilus modification protein PilV [Pseudomonadota bacterium]|nr:type IV pilus modification protein PilV [Pseudomonadota bacterium]